MSNKYGKQLLDTGIYVLKAASGKVAKKEAESIGKFLGNKIADKICETR